MSSNDFPTTHCAHPLGVTPTRSARTSLMDVPAYGPLVGLGGIVFGLVIGWFLGAARGSGKSDWGGKGKRY